MDDSIKILIAEDDPNIRELVTAYLEENNYQVLQAKDGQEALEICERDLEIDLFILDIMLPFFSGIDILEKIRNHPFHQEKPIVMLTALQDELNQVKSFDSLADDYITKPFSLKVLMKRVEALLRRHGGSIHAFIEFGEITIDRNNYEVFEGALKVPLTLKEYELFMYLYENKDRVLSRDQLLNGVWGYSYFGDDRIIDAHIKNIRKKFSTNLIKTVKGVGYKFELFTA